MRASSRSIWLLLLFFCVIWQCCVLAQDDKKLATILLKEGSSKDILMELVAQSPNKIGFNATLVNCMGKIPNINVKYSYSDGCIMDMDILNTNKDYLMITTAISETIQQEYANTKSANFIVSIEDSSAAIVGDTKVNKSNAACKVMNKEFTDGTKGYSLNFTAWPIGDLKCDVKLTFHSDYTIYVPPPPTETTTAETTTSVETMTTAASTESTDVREGGISGATIGFISAGVIISISVIAAIVCYLFWKNGKFSKKKRSGSSPVPPSSFKGSSRPTVDRALSISKSAKTAKVASEEKTPATAVEFLKTDAINPAQRAKEEKISSDKKNGLYEPLVLYQDGDLIFPMKKI